MSNDSKSVGIDWTNEEAVRAAHPGAYRTPSGKVIVWEPKIIGCVQKILIKADGWGEARKHSSVVAFESVNRPEAKADHTVCAEAYMDAIEAERDAALAELAKEKGLREQAEKHCAIERKALDSAYSERDAALARVAALDERIAYLDRQWERCETYSGIAFQENEDAMLAKDERIRTLEEALIRSERKVWRG